MLNLPQFCRDITGIPGVDEWTCYQFDSAVRAFGVWVTNRLNNPEDKRKAGQILESCLNDEAPASTFNRMLAFFNMKGFPSASDTGQESTGSKRPSDELIRKVRNRG